MIIAHIIPGAGMGNQMFMYAAGLAAAERLHTEFKLGAWDFQDHTRQGRPYHLDSFPAITEKNALFSETWSISPSTAITHIALRKRVTVLRILRRLIIVVCSHIPNAHVYRAKYCSYSPEFENIPDNSYIVGYFESEKIFAGIKDLVRRKFTFAPECFVPSLTAEVRSCESVAVHIRRGDKVTLSGALASDTSYIRDAMTKITSLTDRPRFFVFSDDIDWCRMTLPQIHQADYTFIDGQTPPQDMALMTQCKHVIMGPSTFSWWGAWLNDNPHKIIIAPDINLWYEKLSPSLIEDRKYLLPPEWIKIS